jgi:uncharacterized membrane protein (UPF0127 family)
MARTAWIAPLAILIGALSACGPRNDAQNTAAANDISRTTIPLTVDSSNGRHAFVVEVAKTADEQERGLMYRTDIPQDGGMIFAPYPPEGGSPREASFWMKNTPSPLDIIFIRADGTIAKIAENAVPFDQSKIPSGEPVGAVLEIRGGRSLDLGIEEGDKVRWPGHGQ